MSVLVSRATGWVMVTAMVVVAVAGVWVARGAAQAAGSTVAPAYGKRPAPVAAAVRARQEREALFSELQPVKLLNCELARYGEAGDGGYLLCKNLLRDVRSAYSYGISGYDGWGCQVSTELRVPVHQYDCFNTTQPSCPTGRPIFHPECIAGERSTDPEGRLFDSLNAQFIRNGDLGKHLVVKMDVEGAEWDTILNTPDEVLDLIDQFVFEFHGIDRDIGAHREVVARLKRLFHVAHLHFNNNSCVGAAYPPFPAWAYEVTFVNKRLAQADPQAGKVTLPGPHDAPNTTVVPDCQTVGLLQ